MSTHVTWAHGHDHERAQAALASGQLMPLPALLAQLERSHPGQVMEVELEQKEGRWLYEIRLLQTDGQLRKLKLDGKTGEVITHATRARRLPAASSPKPQGGS